MSQTQSTRDKIQLEEKLINSVRNHPYIFDKSHPDYKDKTINENAFSLIKIQLDLDISAEECQKMWTSLRSQYLAYIKKTDKPTGSGTGRPPYFRHAKSLAFLSDVREQNAVNTLSNSENTENDVTVDERADKDDTSSSTPKAKDVTDDKSLPTFSKSHTKKRELDVFEKKLLAAISTEDKADEFESFCESIAPKLRRLHKTDRILCAQTQVKIQQVLLDAEIESTAASGFLYEEANTL